MKHLIYTGAFLLFACCLFLNAAEKETKNHANSKKEMISSFAKRLCDVHSKERRHAVQELRKNQKDIVNDLCIIVSIEKQANFPRGAMILAIELLGELRDPVAIPCLLDYLTYRPLVILQADQIIVPPCVTSLIQIGKPSVKPVLNVLAKGTLPAKRKLLLDVLVGIEEDFTKLHLKRQIKSTKDKAHRANLQLALDELTKREKAKAVSTQRK